MDGLLQDRKDEQAIELAKKANLVCRGAAFIAWDDVEKMAIAQDQVYQPSLDFSLSKSAFAASVFEIEYPEAAPAPCADREPASGMFDRNATRRLMEQLSRLIDSAFDASGAKKLISILLGWAKHADRKHLGDALAALLSKCGHGADAGHLRKVLSVFFLAAAPLADKGGLRAGSASQRVDARRSRKNQVRSKPELQKRS